MTGDDAGRMLVAGVGNIFKSDDGFATAVVARLAERARVDWPDWVRLHDYGIGGVHLAYDLLEGYDEVVLVDAMQRPGGRPGTVYVLDAELPTATAAGTSPTMDAHDLAPETVLALVPALGGTLPPVTVVGCEPESTEDGMGLSESSPRRSTWRSRSSTTSSPRRFDDARTTSGPRSARPHWTEAGPEDEEMTMGKVMSFLGLALIAAVLAAAYPDIKRYVEMRRM